jgi:hypothetical protein
LFGTAQQDVARAGEVNVWDSFLKAAASAAPLPTIIH